MAQIVLGTNVSVLFNPIFTDTNTIIAPPTTTLAVGDWQITASKFLDRSELHIKCQTSTGLELKQTLIHEY